MGNELVSGSDSDSPSGGEVKDLAPFSYTKSFYDHLPFYLSIGMSWDDYWDGEADMAKYYREAFELTQKRQNCQMWFMGGYVYDALCAVSPVLRAFAKEGTKPLPYLKEPIPLTKEDVDNSKQREEKRVAEVGKAKMIEWMKSCNAARKAVEKEVNADGRDNG